MADCVKKMEERALITEERSPMTPPMREAGRSSRVVASIVPDGRLAIDAVGMVCWCVGVWTVN
jgi:hypothetical protein